MPDCSRSSTRNWESVHVRPDVAAFRELDTLVRNLTDQLAGYRRRALAAELRTRELERDAEQLRAALDAALHDAAAAVESREHALAAAREAAVSAREARDKLVIAEKRLADAASASPWAPVGEDGHPENERLRARLSEARDRTTQLADRVRFLRQQITQGVER